MHESLFALQHEQLLFPSLDLKQSVAPGPRGNPGIPFGTLSRDPWPRQTFCDKSESRAREQRQGDKEYEVLEQNKGAFDLWLWRGAFTKKGAKRWTEEEETRGCFPAAAYGPVAAAVAAARGSGRGARGRGSYVAYPQNPGPVGLCLSNCPSVPGPHVQLRVCEPQGAAPQEALPSGGLSLTLLFFLPARLHSWLCVCPTAMLAHAVEVTTPTPSVYLPHSLTTPCLMEEFEYLHTEIFLSTG
ncbi:RNA-binding protein Musashi homolog 2a isoform X1 [Tachysurus ichikawai]